MGSIQKRGENTYFLTVSHGFGLNGKRLRHTKTVIAKDERHAQKLLNQFEAEVIGNNFTKMGKMLFSDFAPYWQENYAKSNIEDRTYQTYDEIVKLRLVPAFGKLRLEQIQPHHILQFYENLQEDGIRKDKKKGGLSPTTIRHHHRLLSLMFRHAVSWKLMKENPASGVKTPKVERAKISFYTNDQLITLIEKLNTAPDKYKSFIMVAIYSGFSRSEILALKWENINLDNCTLRVDKAIQYIRKKGVSEKDPKNKYRNRTISVPKFIIDMLLIYRTIQNEDKMKLGRTDEINKGYVFAQEYNGTPMHPDSITSWFHNFIVENNLPHITLHGLRHSHATILINNNTDIVTVSRKMGHNKTSTTMDIYAQFIESAERATSEKFENALKKSPVDNSTNLIRKTVDKSKVSSNCHQGKKKASS